MQTRAREWLVLLMLPMLLLVAPAARAQAIGRVLLSAGDVVAERSGQAVPLVTGAILLDGDLVRVGADSNAQLRFSDESVVALRARTIFRIDRYQYSGRDDGISQAVYTLLRGGIRTITGAIGRTMQERYRVNAPLATLGVRGTAYTLVVCQQDCYEAEGVLAPDGNYGLVLEGRVAVTNAAGTVEFGLDEAFQVLDAKTLAQPLLSRPGFLRDQLEARARQKERREAAQLARQEALRQGQQELRRDDLRVGGTAAAPIVATDLRDESGNIAVLGAGLGVGISWSGTQEERAQIEGGRGTVIILDGQTKALEKFVFLNGGMAGSREQAGVQDGGALGGDGAMVWGRWNAGAAINLNGQILVPPTGVHFIYGNLTPPSALLTTAALRGTVEYDYQAGPRPADAQGNLGQFLNGTFVVNFLDRTIVGGVQYQVGTITYTLPVPQNTPLIGGQGFVGFGLNRQDAGQWRCSCNNSTGSLDTYSIAGMFMGSRAQGLGVTFSTLDQEAGRSSGAAAFRCRGPRC